MALFEWGDDLLIGVLEIDDQHQRLVELINLLHDSILKSDSESVVEYVLDELVDYTVVHFTVEQYLMKLHGYSESPSHMKEHDGFIEKIEQLRKNYHAGHANIQQNTLDFLKDWLYNHIMKVDKDLGKYLNEKGVF